MQSEKYEKVKSYYDRGLWSSGMVQNAVTKAWITAAELLEIIGEI